jgi:hypothetical protein
MSKYSVKKIGNGDGSFAINSWEVMAENVPDGLLNAQRPRQLQDI